MFWNTYKFALAIGALAIVSVAARSDLTDALAPLPGISYKVVSGGNYRHSAADKVTKNYQRISGLRGSGTNSKSVVARLGTHQRVVGGGGFQNITSSTAYGTQYAVPLKFHQTELMVLLDTGSADTWVVQEGFSCVDFAGESIETANCGFGTPYPGDFQYGVILDEHFYLQYDDGEMVYGSVGYTDITVGTITVKQQEAGLANTTYWYGNNMTSGLLGLAYPTLTNAFIGDGMEHSWLDQVSYSPLFTTMVSEGLIQPYFSIAIDRNSSGGMIGWGGLPPVTGLDRTTAVSLDIIITNLIDNPFTSWDYSFYTIIPDGFQWGSTTDLRKFPFIVDTGTTLLYLPPPLAQAINAAFKPAAVYLWMYGAYFTACNAQAPTFAVILKGVRYYINPVDLIYREMVDPLTGLCMTGIASGGTGPYVLGDVFMQNVLAVFDVGNAQMRFMSRPFY